jgi:hypothetical protein
MIKAAAYLACIPFAILVDWGAFVRISLSIIILRNLNEEKTYTIYYKLNIFPRVLATALGALAICYDAFHQETDRRYLWIGVTLFLSSLLYAIVATYWPRKQKD